MPTYNFKCEECGYEFEKFKKMQDSDEVEICPRCYRLCKKIITGGSGFILKGEGWEKDGYSDKIETKKSEDKI